LQEYLNESIEPPKNPATQLNKICQIESFEPGEHQKPEIVYHFWEKMSGDSFECSFQASQEAYLPLSES
jgi:hypothetical protein